MIESTDTNLAETFHGRIAVVTGGAGFIGSHLSRKLSDLGCSVRVFDDLSTGRLSNLPGGIEFERGCITDRLAVDRVVGGADFVFHLGALVSVPVSVHEPRRCFDVNVVGTQNVIDAAVRSGVRGFVHTSSAAVYGRTPSLPSRESDQIECHSPYAASKACGEFLVQAAARSSGLHGVSVRLFNVFGVRQDPRGAYAAAISAFVDAALAGRAPKIFGDGSATRDFVPVSEVVSAMLLSARAAEVVRGESFNVGLGDSTQIRDVCSMIYGLAGCSQLPEFLPVREGDVPFSCASIEKAQSLLGFLPRSSVLDGLRQLVADEASKRP